MDREFPSYLCNWEMIHSGSVKVSPKIFCFWKQPLFFISKAETYSYTMLFWASERNKTEKVVDISVNDEEMARKWAEFLCLQHNGYSKLVYVGMYVAISWGTQNSSGYSNSPEMWSLSLLQICKGKTVLWSGPRNPLHVQQHWLHTESTWHAWLKTCFRTVWLFVRTTCLQQAYFYFYLTMMLPQRSCFLFKLSELLLLGGPWLLAVFRSGLQWHMVLFHTSWCFVVLFTSEVSEIPPMIKNNFPDPAFQPLCKKHFFPRRCFG